MGFTVQNLYYDNTKAQKIILNKKYQIDHDMFTYEKRT